MIHILPDEERVALAGVRLIATLLRGHDRSGRGPVSLVLSGGRTPRRAYAALAGTIGDGLPWDHLRLLWGDERCVPPDDERSNYFLAASTGILARGKAGVYRMPGELAPEEGARAYAAQLADLFPEGDLLRLDVVLLGLGEDGHTASLFPGSTALRESERLVVATEAQGGLRRLTLTLPVLANARNLLFLVTGEAKAPAVWNTLGGAGILAASRVGAPTGSSGVADPVTGTLPGPAPARMLLDMIRVKKSSGWECPTVTWVLDKAAASGLGERRNRLDGGPAPR